ncbi:apolipoprotein A-II [Dermochelys coriacea]|uniref:apolipoprotein A-II n=1 Tax=Dermochelys coriacea TaxID=27794 RepID=UPI0018E6F7C0|nr:apolipoprotein A-II [Dermochelys coriacea]
MKVLVLAMVLLCVCSLEGAVVKRDAETPSSSLSDVFSQYFQTVSEYLSKQLPEKVKAEEIKTQAKAYLEQANEQLSPIAKRLHTEFMDLLTQLVETGKKAVPQ